MLFVFYFLVYVKSNRYRLLNPKFSSKHLLKVSALPNQITEHPFFPGSSIPYRGADQQSYMQTSIVPKPYSICKLNNFLILYPSLRSILLSCTHQRSCNIKVNASLYVSDAGTSKVFQMSTENGTHKMWKGKSILLWDMCRNTDNIQKLISAW